MMVIGREKSLRAEIIDIGRKLYALRLVVARAGNISARINDTTILVTATGASLGALDNDEILTINLSKEQETKNPRLTSEFPLHSLIYRQFPCKTVIHCHPPLINAYFAVCDDLKTLTFESKLSLGNIPVIPQDTPAVTDPEKAIEQLKSSNLVVLKNHGVVAIGEKFIDALYLIESLEEAVKTAACARLFKKDILDSLDKELQGTLESGQKYVMFSQEHIQAIVYLVNKDEFIRKKGEELDLTLNLAIALDGCDKQYRFTFEKGRVVELNQDVNAPFVISAPKEVWEMVFLGKLEPFVATMQGKMKLKGELGKLSRWYVPFTRLFELFKQVRIVQ